MPRLGIVVASTRPGRIGLPIAQWFETHARAHGAFELDVIDLKEVGLPMFDEPHHPRLSKYENAHTKQWSQRVSVADAFVLVMPEYNYAPPPALLNAIDYLLHEWSYKPASFVSYGGISAGLRAVTIMKAILTGLKIMPIPEGVSLPFAAQNVKEGAFQPTDANQKAATLMLDELRRWSEALRSLR